jgi:hypothetical protein
MNHGKEQINTFVTYLFTIKRVIERSYTLNGTQHHSSWRL